MASTRKSTNWSTSAVLVSQPTHPERSMDGQLKSKLEALLNDLIMYYEESIRLLDRKHELDKRDRELTNAYYLEISEDAYYEQLQKLQDRMNKTVTRLNRMISNK
jgi:hypothetical protein